MKVFEGKVTARGNVLPKESFRLFSDYENPIVNERRRENVIKAAEGILGQEIPMLPASLYREFTVMGNRANYEGQYFKRRRMALYLTLAEMCEGKGRFTEKLMDVVWAIMEESTWIIPAHLYVSPLYGNATLGPVFRPEVMHGIDLFAAATGAVLALTYNYAKESLDAIAPVICEKIKHSIHERITLPFLQSTFWWTGERGNRINNWCPWIISNILLCAAVIEDELYIRERVVEKSLASVDNFINGYAPDGGCDEGPSYWNAAGASLFDCLEILEDISGGKINVYGEQIIKNIGEYICKMNINRDNFINFADCGPRLCPDSAMIYRFGKKLGSEILVSFAGRMSEIRDSFADQNHCYRTAKGLFSPDIEISESVSATSVFFPDLKVMVVRDSKKPDEGILLAVKGGNNDEMHNHNDVGNFIVYKNGRPVIIDTGVGRYTRQTFSSQRYELWFMQSGYHNLPSFGGVDQKNGKRYKSGCEMFSEEKKSLSMELAAAYPAEAGVESYIRCAALSNGKVSVTDKVVLRDKKQIDFHFMSAAKPELGTDGKVALAEGMTLSYTEGLCCEVEEFEPVGMDTKNMWGTEKLWRIHLRAEADSGEYTFNFE